MASREERRKIQLRTSSRKGDTQTCKQLYRESESDGGLGDARARIGDGVEWSCALNGRRIVLVLGAVGAGHVEDDVDGFVVGVFSVADLAEGAEELGGDVSEDAGALGGDAIADKEKQEPGQELVDLIGGVEFGELIEKVGGKVVGVLLAVAEAGVTEAEAGAGIPGGELTRTARTGALLAMGQILRRERVR
jgi:hypothetical protein